MKKRILKPKVQDAEKAALDRQTTYMTLLPALDEGFQPGYQPLAGIVSDENQRPDEWLENIARFMLTPGEEVGYAIPDVLAREQQLRRLLRLPHEEAMRHQEMIDWRALMALLLLWDSWEKEDTWPSLTLEHYPAKDLKDEELPFQRGVEAALAEARLSQGLHIFALSGERDHVPEKRPLCLLSRHVALTPAANSGDLSSLLPRRISWYNRTRKRFEDPTEYLREPDRTRLVAQLRLLQCMSEMPELQSTLYSPKAALVSLLERFIEDLLDVRAHWREKLENADAEAEKALYIRTMAAYGLFASKEEAMIRGFACEEKQVSTADLCQNPLIRELLPQGVAIPAVIADMTQTTYYFETVPFARRSATYLLEPSNYPGESETLALLGKEIALLDEHSEAWNRHMGERLASLAAELSCQVGAGRRVIDLLMRWSSDHLRYQPSLEHELVVEDKERQPQTLSLLLNDLLGMQTRSAPLAFSDRLLLLENCAQPPFAEEAFNKRCALQGRYAVPPLHPWISSFLMRQETEDELSAARLAPESLSFETQTDGGVRVSFELRRRKQHQAATQVGAARFSRVYSAEECVTLHGEELPYIVLWPCVRMAKGLWKNYYVYAHRPEQLDVWVLQNNAWVQGVERYALAPDGGVRTWQTAVTSEYPSFLLLKRGALSLGALPAVVHRTQLKHESPAVIGMDFGSIATTTMMRQGERVLPAIYPQRLHRALLNPRAGDEKYLCDELLPVDALVECEEEGLRRGRESVYYSVMDMFTDDDQSWRRVFQDGHIYFQSDLKSLMKKSENTLYYDMKWSDESYVTRCLALYLRQVMMQALLAARLAGAPSASWRVSMPNAMPYERQSAYLELFRTLAGELSQSTGMPLTPDLPSVLYATENQADGLYFRGRNEVGAQGGYLNMDIGGGTTDISLWLDGRGRASVEASLLLGCRQILFSSLSARHLREFEQDFAQCDNQPLRDVAHEIVLSLGSPNTSIRRQQKNMFLLDDFFASYSVEIGQMMAWARAKGEVSLLESVLLLNIAFLFALCGRLLARAWKDQTLKTMMRPRMELCVAGNGGRFLRNLDGGTLDEMLRFTLRELPKGHPVRALGLVQSRHPKLEVAIGLLGDEQYMRSTLDRQWAGNATGHSQNAAEHQSFFVGFLQSFVKAFPLAAQRLLAETMEKDDADAFHLRASASAELETIVDNELGKPVEDDLSAYVRCFAAMKRLWKI